MRGKVRDLVIMRTLGAPVLFYHISEWVFGRSRETWRCSSRLASCAHGSGRVGSRAGRRSFGGRGEGVVFCVRKG